MVRTGYWKTPLVVRTPNWGKIRFRVRALGFLKLGHRSFDAGRRLLAPTVRRARPVTAWQPGEAEPVGPARRAVCTHTLFHDIDPAQGDRQLDSRPDQRTPDAELLELVECD